MDEAGVRSKAKIRDKESLRGLSLLPGDILIAFSVLSQTQLPLLLGSLRNTEY